MHLKWYDFGNNLISTGRRFGYDSSIYLVTINSLFFYGPAGIFNFYITGYILRECYDNIAK